MATDFVAMIREMNIKNLVAREEQVEQAELRLGNAKRAAANAADDAAILAAAEVVAASGPVTGARLLVMEADFAGQRIMREAEEWDVRVRQNVQRLALYQKLRVMEVQEYAELAAGAAALAVVGQACKAAQIWEERLLAARHELDVFIAIQNPDEAMLEQFEAEFRQKVVRRRDAANARLTRREKMAADRHQAVLTEHEPMIAARRNRAELAQLYVLRCEDRIAQVVDNARDQAANLLLAAQIEANEICRLAAPQIERAEARAAELEQNAAAQGELNIRLAEAELSEASAELEEARRLATKAAEELNHRRGAESLRKSVGRLARAGQITEAMAALAEAESLEPQSSYLEGCRRAIQSAVEAQQVKSLVRQIESARNIEQLRAIRIEAERLGVTHRVESIWKGQMHKLQEAQARMIIWTNRYAADIARHVVEPGQTVMIHKERPGLVFVLNSAQSVVQLHRMEGRGCWKTIAATGHKINVAELVAPRM